MSNNVKQFTVMSVIIQHVKTCIIALVDFLGNKEIQFHQVQKLPLMGYDFWISIHFFHSINYYHKHNSQQRNTVKPVYNGHPRDLRNWPLNTGSLKTNIFFAFVILYCTSAHCGHLESANDTKQSIISLQ